MPITYGPFPLAGVAFSSNSYTGGSVPAVFDAILYRAIGGAQQLKLTVKLRINLFMSMVFLFIIILAIFCKH